MATKKTERDKLDGTMLKTLAVSPLFAGISAETLAAMLECLKPQISAHPKNSYIVTEGEPFRGLGILLSGEAVVIKENAAGTRTVMTALTAGGMFGEIIAFSSKKNWPASVCARTKCLVATLPPDKITGTCSYACGGHQQLIRNMLLIVSDRALTLNRKVEYLAIKGMRAKIAAYLLEIHKFTGKSTFVMPLKRDDLADFLNVSRTALSREMGRMRDEGIIEFYRSSLKILDIDRLREFAG